MANPSTPYPDTLQDGRYRIEELLGSGGMGLVFRATDTRLDRQVAIKMLADNLSHEDEARERFSREARATAALNHANVVQVYDVGEHDGRPYLVMELVAGRSLAERLRDEGALPPGEVARVAVGALRGLAAAHAAGLLHRDVKPANLLQTPGGETKVVDFGIARAADAGSLTRTGFVLGTLQYLAPERRRGDEATVQSDLFGLGATLFHVLTGTTIDKDDRPDLPAETPPRLRRLLNAMTAEEADHRPGSADAALDILQRRDDATAVLPRSAAPDDAATTQQVASGSPPSTTGNRSEPTTADRDTAGANRDTAGAERDAAPGARGAGASDRDAGTTDTHEGTGDRGGGAEAADAGSAWEWLPRSAREGSSPGRGAAAAVVAIVAVVVVVVIATLTSGGGDSPDGAASEVASADPAPPEVSLTGDPADDARRLADWLRQRGRSG